MRLPKFLDRSIGVRTTILVGVQLILILLISDVWQMQHTRSIIAKDTHRQASHSMEAAIKVIDNRISRVETAVETAASYADLFATDDVSAYLLLQRLISSNSDISAVTLMYRANYFPQHGRYYAPSVSRNSTNDDLIMENIGSSEYEFNYLETDSNWVYTNKLDSAYWCLPYKDSIVTQRGMVSYSVPLHDISGDIYAILCADVALDWVHEIVEEAKPYSYSDVTVISRDSQYLCHPDLKWVQSVNVISFAQTQKDDSFLNLTLRMLRGERGIDTLKKPYIQSDMSKGLMNGTSIVYYAPVSRVQWSICFTIPEEKIMERANQLRDQMIVVLIVVLLATIFILYFVIKREIKPLKQLSTSAGEIAKGNFNVPLPHIHHHDETGLLRDSFENMQRSLAKYVEELKVTTTHKATLESELRIASNIQKSMIPNAYPPFPERNDIDIYGQLTPAKEVGGDLFDFFIRNEKLFFCIGDVSGKGIPASLVMAVTRSLFRTLTVHESNPGRFVTHMNEALSENNKTCMFVTLFVGVLDLPTGRMRYANAGHNAPLLLNERKGKLPSNCNLPLGVLPEQTYTTQDVIIDPGTTIFLYTDGLTEAEDTEHQLFGEQRMIDVAESLKNYAPQEVIGQMEKAVKTFVGTADQSDDLTMLAIHYTQEQSECRFQRTLTLTNDVQEVPLLNTFVDEICELVGFDMKTTMQMNLAIEEAVVNVMNYAYPPGKKGEINISATANDSRLKIIISDSGVPFDPTAKGEADTTLSAEERPIGGLGIFLVRQLMDSVNYEHVDSYNVLTLMKNL